jgi:hypothetical protein
MYKNESPEFYVNCATAEYVWEGKQYYVLRNGDMRIIYDDEIIRYTDHLLAAGIKDDETLQDLIMSDKISLIENPWFEVVNDADPSDDGEVYDTLSDAIERAEELESTI